MAKKTGRNIPIPAPIKRAIRKRFEAGESLIELAIEFKVNYRTLRNISSAEGWVKNSTANLITIQEFLLETEEDIKNRKESDKYLTTITKSMTGYFYELEKNKQRPTNKNTEDALLKRVQALKTLDEVAVRVFKKRTPAEELALRKSIMEYEDTLDAFEDTNKDVDLD